MKLHAIEMCSQELKSLRGQIDYAQQKIDSKIIEPWETREWKLTVHSLKLEMSEKQNHLDYLQSLN